MIITNRKPLVTGIRPFYNLVLIAITLIVIYSVASSIRTRYNVVQVSRQTSICPALLSISRSARDTLIVMKAETLCNSYVLENLK